MTEYSTIRTRREDRLWTLLGVVELTYHPALALAFLLAVEFVAPVPALAFDPLAVVPGGRGVPLTAFLAGVVVVDLATDVVGVYVAGRDDARGDGDE